MNPVSPWIAALADQCLSFYLGQNDQDEVQVEDVDGCLSFSICSPVPKAAIVVLWEQGEHSHRATLTDSKNQIDAIISRDSPDTQGATSPCPPSIKGGPRHLVELSDIKLIFTYSAASPDVCLHINRIKIHRNAVPRGDVPKPKLKKTAALRALMTMACEKIQKARGHAGSHSQTTTGLADSFVSRRDQTMPHSQINSASQFLFSQPPPNMRHGAPKGNSIANRVSLNGSSDLLGLLAPAHPIQTKETATKDEINKSPTSPAYSNITQEVDNFIAECRSQVELSPNQSDDHGQARTIGTVENQHFSKKRNRGSSSPAAHDDDLGPQDQQTPKTSPSKKRQRIDAGEVMPADPTGFEQAQTKPVPSLPDVGVISTKPEIACPSTTNPWEGMTKIPLSEVDIPKDQAELLEGLKWIPQDPGVSAPLCHVPPHLLTLWNKVARRRQHLAEEAQAEEEEQVSERAPTPTPQDPYTSPIPWSPSPNRSPPRDVLPRDTASPPTFVRPSRKIPTPSSTQYSIDRCAKDGDVSMVNGSCSAPQPGHEDINTADQQHSPFLEEVPTNPRNPVSLDYDPGDDPSPNHGASTSLDVVTDQLQSRIQEHSHDETPVENPPLKSEIRDESSSDESDESDETEMETYVPLALGGSLPLSSQPEQELPSSGPSLPNFTRGTIQVVETPAVHTTRLNPDKKRKQRAGFQHSSSQQPYSQAPKTPPSSRVLNTYRSQNSNGDSYLSQGAPNPSLPVSEEESLRVDVLGTQTQTSSVHAPSQGTVQSSSDVVLDSSRPAQRQRGSSIFHLDPSDDPSSFPYARSHSLPMSQLHEPSQDSLRGFSLDGASQVPELSPMEFTTWVAAQGESPSKHSRPPRPEDADAGQNASHSPNVELVARRQGFIGKSDKYAEAQTIYEKFCNDYSPYSGDFAHFTEMCSKLQKMRQKGQLQRSFLWDDFVIQHLKEYPGYFSGLSSQESKGLQYEDFFCSRFSRPQHKKRSLTAHGVDIVASQFVPPPSVELGNPPVPHQATIQSEVTQDKVVQSEVRNTSFTASLVEEIPTLHAQSFDDVPAPGGSMPTATQSSSSSSATTSSDFVDVKEEPAPDASMPTPTQSSSSSSASTGSDSVDVKEEPAPDASMPTATQSSSSSSATTSSDSVEVKEEPDSSFNQPIGSQIITSSNDQKPVPSSHDEEMVDATQYDTDNTRIAADANDAGMTETGMDEIDETQEGDDTHHETASIELGDDTDDRRLSASPAPPAALGGLKTAGPEPPRQRPWFRSLREIYPKGPVWSDDPDTPFKRWARQDQNVLQELRRRGGARVLTDEKGVIRWPTYNQKNPDP